MFFGTPGDSTAAPRVVKSYRLGTIGAKLRTLAPYAVILGAAVYLYNLARHFQFDEVPGRIGPDAWPKFILTLLIATCAFQIARVLLTVRSQRPETSHREPVEIEPLAERHPHLAWIGIALTFAYAYLLPICGFYVSTLIYVALMIYLGRYRRIWSLLLISLVLPLSLMFIFMRVVYISLPLGEGPFKSVSLDLLKVMGVH